MQLRLSGNDPLHLRATRDVVSLVAKHALPGEITYLQPKDIFGRVRLKPEGIAQGWVFGYEWAQAGQPAAPGR